MKFFCIILFCLPFVVKAWHNSVEQTVVYYDDHGLYVAVTPLFSPQRILIDLRRIEDDHLLDSEIMYSGITCWLDDVKDVTGDGNEEILLKYQGGGTGIRTTWLDILTVDFALLKLVEAFSCEVEHSACPMSDCKVTFPDGEQTCMSSIQMLRQGDLRFLSGGVIQYFFSEAKREGVDLILNQKIKMYRYEQAVQRFKLVMPAEK